MAVSVGEIEATLKLRDELSDELKKAADSIAVIGVSSKNTSQLVDLLGKSIKELSNAGVITQANFMAEAIGDIGNVASFTREEQIALNKVVNDAIAEYAKLGQQAPDDIKKLADATDHWTKAEQGAFVELKKVNELVKDFGGGAAIQKANELASAVEKIGGASKLTAEEQKQANQVIVAALDKFRALGQEAPQHLLNLAKATQTETQSLKAMSAEAIQAAESNNRLFVDLKKVNDVVKDFGGGNAIQKANEFAAAVEKIGGASKLTVADQQRVNQAVNEALKHYQALGQQAPQHLLAVEQATRKIGDSSFIGQLKSQFMGLGDQIGKTAASFALGLVSVQALQQGFRILSDFVQGSVKSFLDAEASMAKIDAALRSAGSFTPRLSAQYQALAEQMEEVTTNSDDLQAESIALFTSIGQVGPESMKKVLLAANDLAAGMNIGLVEAATKVAKAIDGQDRTLKAYGIEVDETATKGERLEAVLAGINKQFGGRSAEEIKTTAGAVKQLGHAWDNLKEVIGGAIVQSPAFILFLETTNKLLKQSATDADEARNAYRRYLQEAAARGVPGAGAKLGELIFQDTQQQAAKATSDLKDYTAILKDTEAKLRSLSQAKKDDIQAGLKLNESTKEISQNTGVSANVIELYKDRLQASQSAAKAAASEAKKLAESMKELGSSAAQLTDEQVKQVTGLLQAGKAESDIARAYGLTSTQVKQLSEQLKESEADQKQVAAQIKKHEEALKDLNTGLHTLNKSQFDQIAVMLKAGKSQSDIAEAYHFTAQEVKAVDQELDQHAKLLSLITKVEDKYWKEQIKAAEEAGKRTVENLKKITEAQRDLDALRADSGATDIQKSINNIQRWADEQKRAFIGTAEEAKRFFAIIDRTVEIKIQSLAPSLEKVKAVLFDMANDFPDVLAQAIINGRGISEALRGVLVKGTAGLGKLFGESLAPLGSKIGQLLGSAFGAAGAVLGDVIGKALTKAFGNATKKSREDFAIKLGFENQGDLFKDLQKLGTQGEKLANLGLNVIGRNDEAANRKWMADVQAFYEMIQREVDQVGQALERTDILFTQQMKDFIKDRPEFAPVIQKQLGGAISGLTAFLQVGADAKKAVSDISKEMEKLDSDGVDKADKQWQELNKTLTDNQAILQAVGIDSQGTGEIIGATLAGIFDKLRQSGVSTRDALEQISPAVSALDEQLKAAGIDGGASFDFIKGAVDLLHDKVAGPVLTAIEGLGQGLIGLNNTGLLNQQTFSALTGQIGKAFDALVAQGKDGAQVMRLLQGPLQTVWELQKDFGFAVDESTQALLDQAAQAGIVGDKFRDPMERMIKALDHMVEILEKIAIKFGAIPNEAANAANGVNSAFDGVNVEVPVKFKWSDLRPPEGVEINPPGFAEGTHGQFLDFGKGTLAMLHGREAVVPQGESAGSPSAGGTMQPIVINVDGLKLLEIMAKLADRHGATMPLMYR